MKNLLLLFCFLLAAFAASAQADTLPRFSVKKLSATRIAIGWVNPFANMRQISVQRSFDSSKGYKTIISMADPAAVQNGYADTKAPNDHMWYRIFYVLDGGAYYFTTAKQPKVDTTKTVVAPIEEKEPEVVKEKPAPPPPSFVPSIYVFTNKEGYVQMNLPGAAEKKYNIRFLTEKGEPLFEIKTVKESPLILDKTNFYRAGWYQFELYDGEKLIEKHKFQLTKDF